MPRAHRVPEFLASAPRDIGLLEVLATVLLLGNQRSRESDYEKDCPFLSLLQVFKTMNIHRREFADQLRLQKSILR